MVKLKEKIILICGGCGEDWDCCINCGDDKDKVSGDYVNCDDGTHYCEDCE